MAANRAGAERLSRLIAHYGALAFAQGIVELNGYAERLARDALRDIPTGEYQFTDFVKIGTVITLIVAAMTIFLTPLIYGF